MNDMKENKLIAEFMGYDISTIASSGVEVVEFESKDTKVENLKYHTSWDWLMPVIREVIIRYQVDEGIEIDYDELQHRVMDNDIERAYEEVVEFIKEHNKYICGSCGDHANEVVFNEETDVDECTNCIQ